MGDQTFLLELRTAAEAHERNGEPRTAFLLKTAAMRIDALLLKPRNQRCYIEAKDGN